MMQDKLRNRLVNAIHAVVQGYVDIADEVLLEKLLAFVEKFEQDDISLLLKEVNIEQLIEAIFTGIAESPSKAFGIKIISILCQDVNFVNESLIKSLKILLQNWIDSKSVQAEVCISCAVLEMLKKFTCNDILLETLINKECIETSINCLQSNNVYMRTAAQNFLAEILTKTTTKDGAEKFPLISVTTKKILTSFLEKLAKGDKEIDTWKQNVHLILPILEKMVVNDSKVSEQISSTLLSLIDQNDRKICLAAAEVYAVAIASRSLTKEFIEKIVKILKDPIVIQKFSTCVLSRLTESSDDVSSLLQCFFILPLHSENQSSKDLILATETLSKHLNLLTDQIHKEHAILHLCHILENSAQKTSSAVQRLHIATLECLNSMIKDWEIDDQNCFRLFRLMLNIVENRNVLCLILIKALAVLGALLSRCSLHLITYDMWCSVGNFLKSFLCHPDWEIRDSTFELIYQMALVAGQANREIQDVLLKSGLSQMTWDQLSFEEENFVRSSALLAFLPLSMNSEIWNSLEEKYSKDTIINRVRGFASEECEAIVRRSVCKLISTWFTQERFKPYQKKFQITMQEAMSDFDWEVKLIGLAFWENIFTSLQHSYDVCSLFQDENCTVNETDCLINSDENSNIFKFFEELNTQGFFFAVLQAIDDCDVCVQLQVAQLLLIVTRGLKKCNFKEDTTGNAETMFDAALPSSSETSLKPTFKTQCLAPFDSTLVDSILKKSDRDTVESMIVNQVTVEVFDFRSDSEDIRTVHMESVAKRLLNTDFSSIIKDLQKSTDLHEDNMECLLDDILPDEKLPENDVVIDCY